MVDTPEESQTSPQQDISGRRTDEWSECLVLIDANQDRAVSRDELLSEVWGYRKNLQIETRTVDIHVAKLRRKIEDTPKSPERLVTIRNAGYQLVTQ